MGNTTSQHAFARLPGTVIWNILAWMELDQLLMFSFCSKRALSWVKLLKLEAKVTFAVSSMFTLTIDMESSCLHIFFFPENGEQWMVGEPIRFERFEGITVRLTDSESGEEDDLDLNNFGITIREWLDHITNVFVFSEIGNIFIFEEGERYDRTSLRGTFRGFKIPFLTFHAVPVNLINGFVSAFPQATKLNFAEIPHVSMKSLCHITIQNLNAAVFESCCTVSMKPEDFITINIPVVTLTTSTVLDKDINRTIKLWIAGCNSKIENLTCGFVRGRILDERAIMQGVIHTVVELPAERQQKIMDGPDGQRRFTVTSGYVIQRKKDLVEATIEFGSDDETIPTAHFELIVRK